MAVAIPFVFAIAGGILAPGAAFSTLGAAIGWCVGAWLFGPKASYDNQIFDPGAEELPRINQALRGATMPVLFGTNRVSSQIVWTDNFNTIRKESTTGSGGKSGGSGGGKGGGGPTNISYEYKWDMLFHIGMSPVPLTLYGGWMNASKLTGETILAIARAGGNEGLDVDVQPGDDVSLTFDDSFYGQAQRTGSTAQEPWAYFSSQVGADARFPNTAYVGFQQLFLGSSPNVPQLSWEVGPGDPEVSSDPVNSNNYDTGFNQVSVFVNSFTSGMSVIEGRDGKRYSPLYRTSLSGDSYIASLDGTTTFTINDTDNYNRAVVNGITAGMTNGGSGYVVPCGEDRFWVCELRIQGGSTLVVYGQQYAIDENSQLEVLTNVFSTAVYTGVAGSPNTPTDVIGVGRMGEGTRDDEIGVMFASGNTVGIVALITVPGYNNNSITYNRFRFTELEDSIVANESYDAGNVNTRTEDQQIAFMLGRAEIGLLGVSWHTDLYLYRPSRAIESTSTDATFLVANDAAYPDGYLYRYKFSPNVLGGWTKDDGPDVVNDIIVDRTGQPFTFPFEDDQLALDGVTVDTSNTEYVGPNVQKLDRYQYTWLVVWPKIYQGSTANHPSDQVNTTLRVMIWNAFEQKLTYIGSMSGAYGQRNATANPPYATQSIMGAVAYIDQETSDVSMAGAFDESDNDVWVTNGIMGHVDIGGQVDVTPAYIVYTVLTDTVLGLGIDPDIIDGYADAVAYCEANAIKVSVQYNREEDVLGLIEQCLALYNGFLTISGGRIKFLVQDFSTASVRTLDNHHLQAEEGQPPVTIMKAARQDSYNKVRVNYFDRNLFYRQNMVEVSDEVDMDLTGVRTKEFPAKFVMSEALANMIAVRALWTNLYARDSYQFSVGPQDSDLEPGDPITLVDSYHPELAGGVRARIGRWKQTSPSKWEVVAVRELEYTQVATLGAFDASSPGSKGDILGAVQPALDFRAYELPAEFQLTDSQVFFGYNPAAKTMGARLYISPDGITYGVVGDIQPFVINGIFRDPLPTRPYGYVEQDVTVYISPAAGYDVNCPTYAQTYHIDDVTEAGRAVGAGVLIAGSEAMAAEGITLIDQNIYRIDRLYRGWGGTQPGNHSSGAYWHQHASGVLAMDITPDKIGTQFWYKVAPYNFAGNEYNIASIDAKTWTVKDWPVTPQGVGNLRVYANSATAAQSTPIPPNGFRGVVAGGCDVNAVWPAASRTTGFGAGGYGQGAGGFGRFTRDVTTPSYRVEVLSGNTVIRSTAVSTEAFTYAVDANSTDFNGWKGDFQLRVTPFNGYGVTPISEIHTLHLF